MRKTIWMIVVLICAGVASALVPCQIDGQVTLDGDPIVGAEVKAYIDNGNGVVDEGVYKTTESLDISVEGYYRIVIDPSDFEENVTDVIITSVHEGRSAYLYLENIVEGTTMGNELMLVLAGEDMDSDDVPDNIDNCPDVANKDQSDTDNDGLGDACDPDDDDDSINDTEDNINGDSGSIATNLGCIMLFIGGEEDPDTAEGEELVEIKDCSGRSLVEFNFTFGPDVMDLSNIHVHANEGDSGDIWVSGVGVEKTLYLDRVMDMDTICIKDAEVTYLDVSLRCDSDDENGLVCPGSVEDYTCSISDGRFKVEGLHNSAVRQQGYCGDGECDSSIDESCSTCSADCGSCSSGSSRSSSSDGSISLSFLEDDAEECIPDWICTFWSDCEDGIRTRECTDQNSCGLDKPETRQSCTMPEEQNPLEELKQENQEPEFQEPADNGMESITGAAVGGGSEDYNYLFPIIMILIAAIVVIAVIMVRRSR